MGHLVYTCVFEEYDWVFPPICPEESLTYIIITDDPTLQVPGWQSFPVDTSHFTDARSANRYYKTLIHKIFPMYECSVYVDGNIRLLGLISKFIEEFMVSGTALGLYPHPLRSSVQEEVDVCIKHKKVADPVQAKRELDFYRKEGFPDDIGLIEGGIVLKNHLHPLLNDAMELWWQMFERFGTRDQFSLPYVIWKTGIPCTYHTFSFRDPNPYFGLYTHRGDLRAPRYYGYVEGMAYDNQFYSALLKAWQCYWTIRRVFRKL